MTGNRSRRDTARHGFTLVELLVVIGIIAVLIGILMPALSAARKQANTLKCAAHMRAIGQAFKLYANDNKDYWPVVAQDYPDGGGQSGASAPVNKYNFYWTDELLKYVSKYGTANAVAWSDADKEKFYSTQQSVIWGCPEWDGRRGSGALYINGVYVYEGGYGMNLWPTYRANYPKLGAGAPPMTEWADRWAPDHIGIPGKRYRSVQWTSPATRMLVSETTLWLMRFGPCSTLAQIGAEPLKGVDPGSGPGANDIDRYRHGKYPSPIGSFFDKSGGKVRYNILYCDGHVATATDILEAYRAIRQRDPGT